MTRIVHAASLALSAAMLPVLAPPAAAATETVLYSFMNANYGFPTGRLLLRKGSGALFGTGQGGSASVEGSVFRLTQSGGTWKNKTLATFTGSNGGNPFAGLIQDSSGALYGTTQNGGAYSHGTVFQLTVSGGVWTETVLYNFSGGSDGANPQCDLVMDPSGALYGTTPYGGAAGRGVVFELAQSGGSWTETVIHAFGGGSGGAYPLGGLHRDAATGTLYGTTQVSDANGTVFGLTPSGGTWLYGLIHDFSGSSDGAAVYAGVIEDSKGNLYGTTYAGGAYGYGTVFELVNGFGWSEQVLYSFTGGSDGAQPWAALHLGNGGNLYGTTNQGGAYGVGTVFKLTHSGGWSYSVLHSFGSGGDGNSPFGAVIEDSAGNLYGTTSDGGAYSHGTVWEVTP